MDGSDFQKNKPQRCKTGIKNEVKTFYFGDHIRTLTVISKKKKGLILPVGRSLPMSDLNLTYLGHVEKVTV